MLKVSSSHESEKFSLVTQRKWNLKIITVKMFNAEERNRRVTWV